MKVYHENVFIFIDSRDTVHYTYTSGWKYKTINLASKILGQVSSAGPFALKYKTVEGKQTVFK